MGQIPTWKDFIGALRRRYTEPNALGETTCDPYLYLELGGLHTAKDYGADTKQSAESQSRRRSVTKRR